MIAILDLPIMSPPIYVLGAFAALYCVGLILDSPRVHSGIVLVNALFIVILYAPLAYRPLEAIS